MKKLVLSLAAFTICVFSFAQGKKAEDIAKFESETIDLGKIKQGTPTTATFKVTNIGTDPLLIEQANPTCGCTISNYTKEPISTGGKGEINATYNAANAGAFEKHLSVKFAGVDQVKSITIKGQVLTAEEYAKMNGEPVPAAATPVAETPATSAKVAEVKTVAATEKPKAAIAPAVKKPTKAVKKPISAPVKKATK